MYQHTLGSGTGKYNRNTYALTFLKPRIERHGTTQLGDADILLNDTDAGGEGLQCFGRTDISIENGQRDGKSTHGVRDVNYAANAPLTRAAAQKEVDLFLRIAKLAEIFDALQHSLLVGNGCIQVVLDALLVHRYSLEDEPLTEARLQWADLEYRLNVERGGTNHW